MIFIALLLVTSFSFCVQYTEDRVTSSIIYDTFANFATTTHRVTPALTGSDAISDIYVSGGSVFVKGGISPHIVIRLNNKGEEVATVAPDLGFENRFETHSIHWEASSFVVVGGDSIKKYDYSFNPVTSFGTEGTAQLAIENTLVQLTAVVRHGNYYYVSGYVIGDQDTSYTLAARFTKDGVLDTTFNANNTPGYIILTPDAWWGPHQMLIVDNHIIMRTSRNTLISLSLEDESNIALVNAIGLTETCSITPDATGKSFYAYQVDLNNWWIPTLFKYDTSLALDTSLNGTGKYVIDFTEINSELSSNAIWTLKSIGSQLFLLGGFGGQYVQGPFVLCLSMKESAPMVDKSFLGTGYFIGNPDYYSNAGGTFDMAFSNGSVTPSLFITCGKHIVKIALGAEFVAANNNNTSLIPPTIAAQMTYYESQGKITPLLAGLFTGSLV